MLTVSSTSIQERKFGCWRAERNTRLFALRSLKDLPNTCHALSTACPYNEAADHLPVLRNTPEILHLRPTARSSDSESAFQQDPQVTLKWRISIQPPNQDGLYPHHFWFCCQGSVTISLSFHKCKQGHVNTHLRVA